MTAPQPRTIIDPQTGRPILLAPKRQQRPMHTGNKKVEARCPFCRGHEDDTPPARDEVFGNDGGWIARAFENKYPATLHHEVIAEGADHDEHPCDLNQATWRAALELWRRRVQTMEHEQGLAHAFLFKNVGARAGASIAHNHSQVIRLDALPPRLQLELEQQRAALLERPDTQVLLLFLERHPAREPSVGVGVSEPAAAAVEHPVERHRTARVADLEPDQLAQALPVRLDGPPLQLHDLARTQRRRGRLRRLAAGEAERREGGEGWYGADDRDLPGGAGTVVSAEYSARQRRDQQP